MRYAKEWMIWREKQTPRNEERSIDRCVKEKMSPISSDETPSDVIVQEEEEETQISVGKHQRGVGDDSMNGKFARLFGMTEKDDSSRRHGSGWVDGNDVAF